MKDSRLQHETVIKQYKETILNLKKNIVEYDQILFSDHI